MHVTGRAKAQVWGVCEPEMAGSWMLFSTRSFLAVSF